MANPNVAFRNARKKAGYSEMHVRQVEEARQRRVDESPYVAVMRRVQAGEMTIEEGEAEIKRMQMEGL
jgi:hypothetical protein